MTIFIELVQYLQTVTSTNRRFSDRNAETGRKCHSKRNVMMIIIMDIRMAGRYRTTKQIRLHCTVVNNSTCRQVKCKMQAGIMSIILTVNPITTIDLNQS